MVHFLGALGICNYSAASQPFVALCGIDCVDAYIHHGAEVAVRYSG